MSAYTHLADSSGFADHGWLKNTYNGRDGNGFPVLNELSIKSLNCPGEILIMEIPILSRILMALFRS